MRRPSAPLTMIVPSNALGAYVGMGFVLADRPDCSAARLVLPNSTGEIPQSRVPHRVPDNRKLAAPGKEKAGPRWRRGPGERLENNEPHKRARTNAQA